LLSFCRFKNPFARKPKAAADADATAEKKEEAPKKLSAKELRQRKKDKYYQKKAQATTAAPSDAASPTSPRSASPSSLDANSATSPVAESSPAADAGSVTSGRSAAASPELAGENAAVVGAGEDGSGRASPTTGETPALINKSGSSEVETYQPPRVEAERRRAEAAAMGLVPVVEGEETPATAGTDNEDRDGEAADSINPMCNYCGCFN
jgi:hypothetical protein